MPPLDGVAALSLVSDDAGLVSLGRAVVVLPADLLLFLAAAAAAGLLLFVLLFDEASLDCACCCRHLALLFLNQTCNSNLLEFGLDKAASNSTTTEEPKLLISFTYIVWAKC